MERKERLFSWKEDIIHDKQTNKQTNKERKKEYGAFLIKPDAVLLGQDHLIIRDISRSGLCIEHIKRGLHLNLAQIRQVWQGNEFPEYVWEAISSNYVREESIAIFVSPNGIARTNGESIHDILTRLKGKPKNHGLRGKYQEHTKVDCERIASNIDELATILGHTRVHGTANENEFRWMTETLLTGRDMDKLRIENNFLFQHLANYEIR